jgi:hypothetical protein
MFRAPNRYWASCEEETTDRKTTDVPLSVVCESVVCRLLRTVKGKAASGFEPLHRGFADLSLNHLGTPPGTLLRSTRAHGCKPCLGLGLGLGPTSPLCDRSRWSLWVAVANDLPTCWCEPTDKPVGERGIETAAADVRSLAPGSWRRGRRRRAPTARGEPTPRRPTTARPSPGNPGASSGAGRWCAA